ncbi:MAG: Beta-galactosidase C-terminal domain, partial [Clostridia bacterium]|nr:Beta-galactosidase C-terminal domain [Clostridia bacterium]
VCETGCAEGTVELPCPMTDILTGISYEGTMTVQPYAVHVLVKQ